jgi:hypothetical protein
MMPGAEGRLVRQLAAVGCALSLRVYYHLRLVEAYLQALGLEVQRSFGLTPDAVRAQRSRHLIHDRRLILELADARRSLGFVPMKTHRELRYEASSPLLVVVGDGGRARARSQPRGPLS